MKILFEKPPIFEECIKKFNIKETDVVFFTYGDTCYSPSGKIPAADVIRHEETHMEQQAHDRTAAKIWWQRYLADANFRMEQEIEAYGEQYKFICQSIKDRNKQYKRLWEIATHLSSPLYDNCITHSEALKRVRDYATGKDILSIEEHIKDEGDL